MKQVNLDSTSLQDCVTRAQNELIVLTDQGQPVAMVVGVAGLDDEQIEFGSSAKFWDLIQQRRKAATLSRADLAAKLSELGT
jgi:antitoxin (DNA-binding transcriptional repressor) of toxin-antitoxin stability system